MYKSRLIYLSIIIAAFVFSQALYESISFMTLIIALLLPIISVLLALVSYPLVSVKARVTSQNISRFDKFALRVTIMNKSPFVSPSFKIFCTVPSDDGRTTESVAFVLNSAFARRGNFDYNCYFAYRGVQTVSVDTVEYYDFLKLIKIKRKLSKSVSVDVSPRKLDLRLPVVSELNTQDNSNISGVTTVKNGGDMLGVRNYVMGDNLKDAHWKLSAKKDDLIIKSFAENVFDRAYIIVDLSAYYSDTDQSRCVTDCVVETALSAIRDYSKSSVRFGLIFNTGRSDVRYYSISTPFDAIEAQNALAVAPMVDETSIVDLLNNIDFNMLSGSEVCIITSFGVSDVVKSIRKMFIDKRSGLNIVNISEFEDDKMRGVTVFSREYIEKLNKVD